MAVWQRSAHIADTSPYPPPAAGEPAGAYRRRDRQECLRPGRASKSVSEAARELAGSAARIGLVVRVAAECSTLIGQPQYPHHPTCCAGTPPHESRGGISFPSFPRRDGAEGDGVVGLVTRMRNRKPHHPTCCAGTPPHERRGKRYVSLPSCQRTRHARFRLVRTAGEGVRAGAGAGVDGHATKRRLEMSAPASAVHPV